MPANCAVSVRGSPPTISILPGFKIIYVSAGRGVWGLWVCEALDCPGQIRGPSRVEQERDEGEHDNCRGSADGWLAVDERLIWQMLGGAFCLDDCGIHECGGVFFAVSLSPQLERVDQVLLEAAEVLFHAQGNLVETGRSDKWHDAETGEQV